MQPNETQKKKLVFISVIVGLLLFGWLVSLIARDANKVKVDVVVFPSDAALTVDGTSAKPGKIAFSKGKHTLKVTRKYFGDGSATLDTATVNTAKPFFVATDPTNSREAAIYLDSHPEEENLWEAINGDRFVKTQDKLVTNSPIVMSLPHEAIDYKIDYNVNADKSITLIVTLSLVNQPGERGYEEDVASFKSEALDWLKLNGADVNKIPIVYQNTDGQKL